MIESSTTLRVVVALCVFFCTAVRSFNVCFAQSPSDEGSILPLSPALAPVPGERTRKDVRTSVSWEGRDLPCADAARVLMEVIVDKRSGPSVRAKALRTLRRVPRRYLRTNGTIQQLMLLYGDLQDRQEKVDVISLIAAWSRRALPFLATILDREEDRGVRRLAAGGLAAWNVRRGVAELIRVLEECEENLWADHTVCDDAAKVLPWLSLRKGWRFPEEDIAKLLEARTDLDQNQKRALYVSEIKRWFGANEHRFPDWKLGDPLPEVRSDKDKEAGEE